MKLSLFTPTNNTQWLLDTFYSLKAQAYENYEWVIVPNSGKTIADVPPEIVRDPRVRIVTGFNAKNIGALKRFACDSCVGDVFIEMDHDDLLVPGALDNIAAAAKRGGFIYSDVACFKDDNKLTPVVYDASYGWESYELYVYNHYFRATRAFYPVTPRALCEVHYAPDHVRCWTREAYYKAGGHDKNLLVADDHDLVCRTYLAGVKFVHTGHCDYLYRMHPNNSVRRYGQQIQQLQAANRDAYLWRLIDEWCRREGLPFLELKGPRETLLDKIGKEPNQYGCIKLADCLQTFSPDAAGKLLTAAWNAVVPDGFLCLRCPSTDGRGAYMPSCRSYWNPEVVECLVNRELAPQFRSYRGRLQKVRCWQDFENAGAKERNLLSVYADLCVLKEGRQAGRQRI